MIFKKCVKKELLFTLILKKSVNYNSFYSHIFANSFFAVFSPKRLATRVADSKYSLSFALPCLLQVTLKVDLKVYRRKFSAKGPKDDLWV